MEDNKGETPRCMLRVAVKTKIVMYLLASIHPRTLKEPMLSTPTHWKGLSYWTLTSGRGGGGGWGMVHGRTHLHVTHARMIEVITGLS